MHCSVIILVYLSNKIVFFRYKVRLFSCRKNGELYLLAD